MYSWLLCIRVRNRHLCITRHTSLGERSYLDVHLWYPSVYAVVITCFTYINSTCFTAISLLTSFITPHSFMSSIGHLVLYLVDPVSGDTTRGLEQLTKTQRDWLPNHSIFGTEVLQSQSNPPIRSEQLVLVSGRDRYTTISLQNWNEFWVHARQTIRLIRIETSSVRGDIVCQWTRRNNPVVTWLRLFRR